MWPCYYSRCIAHSTTACCAPWRRKSNRRVANRAIALLWDGDQHTIASGRRLLSSSSSSKSSAEEDHAAESSGPLEDWTKHPEGGKLDLDFFGMPVTFCGISPKGKIRNAMAALDAFQLCAVSKGKTSKAGGDEGGLAIRFAHSAAVSWSEALRFAAVWNQENDKKSAPMLAVVAVAPVLAQAGIGYVKHLDGLLAQAKPAAPGLPPIQMYDLAVTAVARGKEESLESLNERERMHIDALEFLLEGEYPTALAIYLKILRNFPGDAFAMSLAMDLSQNLGDKQSAFRAAGSVAAYWNERAGGMIRPAIPGFPMVSSLMALGFSVGGRHEEAEQIAERAMKKGKSVCGALATWAQTHIFDAGGRVSEGISALANFDGIANYEGSGFLFFECRLSGYGARFSLDREERGRGKSAALRLYENNFARVLEYSGFAQGQAWKQPLQSAPISWTDPIALDEGDGSADSANLFNNIFGRSETAKKDQDEKYEVVMKRINFPSTQVDGWEPTCEDVLTWLPPTPAFLSDTTLLLLRFTFNGTISPRNARWDDVRNAWSAMLDIQEKHGGDLGLRFLPLASIAASLLFPPSKTGGDQIGNGRLAEGLYRMGELLKLGNPQEESEKTTSLRELIAERDPDFWLPSKEGPVQEWKVVVNHLASAIDGFTDFESNGDDCGTVDTTTRLQAWDFEARPILEHAICYAACKAGDSESLLLARSICSQGVTLRQMSPEEWWRYSIILGLLGDEVASEDAWNHSINFGSGQGGRS